MLRKFVAFSVCALLFVQCRNSITYVSDSNKEYKTKIGDTIVVDLRTQLNSGYSWQQDVPTEGLIFYNDTVIQNEVTGDTYTESQQFFYVCKKSGNFNPSFIYKRPWEDSSVSQRKVEFKIKIR